MSLTVYQQPQAYTPAYNAQTFTAKSNQIAISDFKYIVTVQINGGTIFTFNILQRPDGYLVYDPIELVKNYISRNYFDPITIVTCEYANGKSCAVEVKIKEFYTNAIQSTTTINYIAWDACLSDIDFRNYNYLNYISNGVTVKLLSNNVLEFNNPENKVDIKNDIWLHFFRNSCDKVVLRVFNELSVLQGTINLTIPTTNQYIYYVNVGYTTLKSNGYNCKDGWSVEIDIVNGVTTYLATFYKIEDICSKNKKYTLQYLKRNGNINRFNFFLVSEETANKKNNTVRLNPSKIVNNVYQSKQYDREKYVVSTEITKSIKLNTNWITESQSEALSELWDSPLVWLVNESNEYIPVTITDTQYKYDKHINSALFNYSVTCEYGIQETRQRAI